MISICVIIWKIYFNVSCWALSYKQTETYTNTVHTINIFLTGVIGASEGEGVGLGVGLDVGLGVGLGVGDGVGDEV